MTGPGSGVLLESAGAPKAAAPPSCIVIASSQLTSGSDNVNGDTGICGADALRRQEYTSPHDWPQALCTRRNANALHRTNALRSNVNPEDEDAKAHLFQKLQRSVETCAAWQLGTFLRQLARPERP